MHKIGIVGYRGYSGAELDRILKRHSGVEVVLLDHRETGETPAIRNAKPPERLESTADAVAKKGIAIVFLATPADVSMELAPAMLQAGLRVIDLSGAFRLGTAERYAT